MKIKVITIYALAVCSLFACKSTNNADNSNNEEKKVTLQTKAKPTKKVTQNQQKALNQSKIDKAKAQNKKAPVNKKVNPIKTNPKKKAAQNQQKALNQSKIKKSGKSKEMRYDADKFYSLQNPFWNSVRKKIGLSGEQTKQYIQIVKKYSVKSKNVKRINGKPDVKKFKQLDTQKHAEYIKVFGAEITKKIYAFENDD